jgi:hypothetical protein
MIVNLHKLACELAKMDAPGGYNQSVIGAETTLKSLGKKLRTSTTDEAISIIAAIVKTGKF